MEIMPAIARELSKLGPYRFLDWTQYMELGKGAQAILKRDIIKITNEIEPDFTFLHIQRPGVIDEETVQLLKGVIFNYTYDVAVPTPEWFYEIGKHIDTTIFSDESGIWDLRSKDISADFLHVGYDNMIFRSEGTRGEYGDIVFLGNNYSTDQNFHLTKKRIDMIDCLKDEYGDSFKVYGNGWKYNDGNLMYREYKEAECYRSCKIAINISHFDIERYTSDRIFRIMGCGAFCLSKWYPGIEKDFVDGKHLRVWKDFDELKTLINYYLEHEDERNSIALAGYKYVTETATWTHRMKTIIEMASAKMSKEYKSRVVKVAQQFYVKPVDVIPPTNIITPEPDPTVPPEIEAKDEEPIIIPIQRPVIVQPARTPSKLIQCINDFFDKIYCINLDRRPDKWLKSFEEFSKNNLIVDRVSAIDGNNLGKTRINPWELGCFQSHILVLRDMIKNGYEKILVLEDDIEFMSDVQTYFVNNAGLIPTNWQMLYFGGNHINPPIPINSVISKITRTYTTASYGITKNTAQGLINRAEKRSTGQTQIDVMYSEIHHSSNCYTFSPKIAWQRPGWSDVQNGEQDYSHIIK